MEPVTARNRRAAKHSPAADPTPEGLDQLLRLETVCATVALGRSTIWRKVAAGQFPQPLRVGLRCSRWRASDVAAWMAGPRGPK